MDAQKFPRNFDPLKHATDGLKHTLFPFSKIEELNAESFKGQQELSETKAALAASQKRVEALTKELSKVRRQTAAQNKQPG